MDRLANHRHGPQENVEKTVDSIEGIALSTLAGLTVLTCFIIPVISQSLI